MKSFIRDACCPKCSKMKSAGDMYCPHCGQSPVRENNAYTLASSTLRHGLISVTISLLILLAGYQVDLIILKVVGFSSLFISILCLLLYLYIRNLTRKQMTENPRGATVCSFCKHTLEERDTYCVTCGRKKDIRPETL